MALIETNTFDSLIQKVGNGIYSCIFNAVILAGQNLVRGSVLGKITKGDVTETPDSGNTGTDTFGTVTLGSSAMLGDYVVTCTTKATGASVFQVVTPKGVLLAPLTQGVAYASSHLNGTLGTGGTDFEVGDFITISVAAGSGKFKLCDKSAVDGSADPYAVLVQDIDASEGDIENVAVYSSGGFGEDGLVFAAGTTAADMFDAMRDKGMDIVPTTEEG